MTNERFIELFDKSRTGVLSELEAIEWNEWIALSAHNLEMVERIHDEGYLNRTAILLAKARQEDWQHIIEKHPELRPEEAVVKHMKAGMLVRVWIAAAVAIILIVSTTYWYINNKKDDSRLANNNKKQIHDIKAPDTTRARITLANGQVVALDTLGNSVVTIEGKVNVVKTSDGQIAYKGAAVSRGEKETYNILTNPRGSKIVSIILSDGTKVWLNNESTLRYPVVVNSNERRVELSGEAYFEVAPSYVQNGKKRSFVVIANKATIEVLGTHFNVNNYLDESATKVTLLEGSVKVGNRQSAIGNNAVILKPGEQASVSQSSQVSQPIPVQTDEVIGWKNNTFYFDGENLQAIMKQLARFYNVEVEYEGNVPDKKFGGMINRNKNLNEVLNVLELSGVHFKIEGNKIIVLK